MTEDIPADGGAQPDPDEQRTAVRERYGAIAGADSTCCGDEPVDGGSDCCGDADASTDAALARGYDEDDVEAVAGGANLNLGCGNPTAIAGLEPDETVVDLGSGAGFDCFLAGQAVGETGRVIGVDMTPEMIERARENVERNDATNVEFRLGEIEHLPVADETADVILSNCVVNLSPDKKQVFREAYRVLRPGGRLAISDVVLTADLPVEYRTDLDAIAACVGGAAPISALESMLAESGFTDIEIESEGDSETFIREWDDDHDPSEYVVSATIEARKPTA